MGNTHRVKQEVLELPTPVFSVLCIVRQSIWYVQSSGEVHGPSYGEGGVEELLFGVDHNGTTVLLGLL